VARRLMKLALVAFAAIALVASVGGGGANAKKKNPSVKTVTCTGTGEVTCSAVKTGHDVVIKVDAPADTGTGTGTGTGSTGGLTGFSSRLLTGQTKSATVNGFLFETTGDATNDCGSTFISNDKRWQGHAETYGEMDDGLAAGTPEEETSVDDDSDTGSGGTIDGTAFFQFNISCEESDAAVATLSGVITSV